MGTIKPCSSSFGDCNRDVEQLLEAFGSAFSLEAITTAYSQAKHDADLAGVILCELQGSTSMTCESKDKHDAASVLLPELTSGDASQCSSTSDENLTSFMPSSTVSCESGGEYARPTLSGEGSSRIQSSEVDSNRSCFTSCSSEKDSNSMPDDIEEFLFKMLGDGFQLDMKVIHEVLGLCGYDLEKSMETLVDMSASSLEKSDDVVSMATEISQKYLKNDSHSCSEKSELPDSSLRSPNQNGKKLRKKNQDNYNLEREILGALFTGRERVEERPKQTTPRTGVIRSSAFGRSVFEPLRVTKIDQTFVTSKPLGIKEEGEYSFEDLRQAVKEYWTIMKEYYKAAAEAFTKGDQRRAYKLMQEGQFYNSKAREADEKSAQKLLDTSCSDEEMLLDLSTLEPRQAIKLLRVHLSNLAGIPSIPSIKATVGNDDGQNKTRRLILKLLEKESIKWTEEEDGKTIAIRLNEINPKRLSFANKVGPQAL